MALLRFLSVVRYWWSSRKIITGKALDEIAEEGKGRIGEDGRNGTVTGTVRRIASIVSTLRRPWPRDGWIDDDDDDDDVCLIDIGECNLDAKEGWLWEFFAFLTQMETGLFVCFCWIEDFNWQEEGNTTSCYGLWDTLAPNFFDMSILFMFTLMLLLQYLGHAEFVWVVDCEGFAPNSHGNRIIKQFPKYSVQFRVNNVR